MISVWGSRRCVCTMWVRVASCTEITKGCQRWAELGLVLEVDCYPEVLCIGANSRCCLCGGCVAGGSIERCGVCERRCSMIAGHCSLHRTPCAHISTQMTIHRTRSPAAINHSAFEFELIANDTAQVYTIELLFARIYCVSKCTEDHHQCVGNTPIRSKRSVCVALSTEPDFGCA